MKKTPLALAALLLALPCAAAAQQAPAAPAPGPVNTLSLKLGVYSPKSSDLEGMDNGGAFELAYTRRINPNLALEGSIGRLSTSASASGGGASASATVSAVPVLFTAKAIYPTGNVDLYGMAGLGIYFAKVEASYSDGMGGTFSGSDSGSKLGLHLGAGAAVHVSQQLDLGAELRYQAINVDFEGGSLSLNGLIAQVFLGYRF